MEESPKLTGMYVSTLDTTLGQSSQVRDSNYPLQTFPNHQILRQERREQRDRSRQNNNTNKDFSSRLI